MDYSSVFEFDLNEKSLYSCNLLCRKLGDLFDAELKKATIHLSFQNDYFRIIHEESLEGYVLTVFDTDEILYPFILLETELANKPHIYNLLDSSFSKLSERVNKNLVCIFLKCTVIEADKYMFYLTKKIEETKHSFANVTSYPAGRIYDLSYIYPMNIVSFEKHTFLTSSVLTNKELQTVVYQDEFPLEFNLLSDLDACYAMHLLGEAVKFAFPLRWKNFTLYVGMCGYNQALDIRERFVSIITDIARENIQYERGLYENCRGFVCNNEFYSAITATSLVKREISYLPKSIVFIDSGTKLVDEAYFASLGYIVVEEASKESVPISWVTVEKDGEITTNYYIESSSGIALDIKSLSGVYSEENESQLRKLFHFTRRAKNYMNSYDLIPSDFLIFT